VTVVMLSVIWLKVSMPNAVRLPVVKLSVTVIICIMLILYNSECCYECVRLSYNIPSGTWLSVVMLSVSRMTVVSPWMWWPSNGNRVAAFVIVS
jgi:hypothetical protein